MGNPATYHLFVYGSLRSGFRSPAYEYISRYFIFVGEGKVKGRMYDMGEYPAAVPTEEDSFIIGELYAIKNQHEFSWAIGQLDDYEGMTIEPGEPQLYVRGLADVFINNTPTSAWMYWYNGDTTGRPIIASGDILDYIKNK
jgi:gamma-glutamylcyclotransferase (GGCT)/AIG2-like uncharacterized protein YtfP